MQADILVLVAGFDAVAKDRIVGTRVARTLAGIVDLVAGFHAVAPQ